MSEEKLENVSLYLASTSPPCRFILMVMKQLNIDCVIKEINVATREHKSPEFLAINPAGKIPSLKDGDLYLGER